MSLPNRRRFLVATAAAAGVFATNPIFAVEDTKSSEINVLGPKPGYTPQVGTLVSMLTWMQRVVPPSVKGLSQKDLDYLMDANANSIGALLLHLSATETLYQMLTFENLKPDPAKWPEEAKHRWEKWDAAMELGDAGRKTIKGHDLTYYLDTLHASREKTLAELKQRDDPWLMSVDKDWGWGPTNNYCKWFHVCEHQSHHTGQIDFLKKRLPGAKPEGSSGF